MDWRLYSRNQDIYRPDLCQRKRKKKKENKKSIKIKAKSLNRQMNSATTRSTASTIGLIERNRSPNTI